MNAPNLGTENPMTDKEVLVERADALFERLGKRGDCIAESAMALELKAALASMPHSEQDAERVADMEKVAAYLERQGSQCNAHQPIVPVAGSELLKAAGHLRWASRKDDEPPHSEQVEGPRAWMRRYAYDREHGTKGNRPKHYKFAEVTVDKLFSEDVPLFTRNVSDKE